MKLKFTAGEKDIFAPLLQTCEDALDNNSCNDYPIPVTDENREAVIALIDGIAMDEDHRENMMEQLAEGEVCFQDAMVLSYLREQILKS